MPKNYIKRAETYARKKGISISQASREMAKKEIEKAEKKRHKNKQRRK